MKLDDRGLTLAEVLAAVAIIGIGIVGLMIVVPISSYGVSEGHQLSTATFLAEERLEQVKNAPWTTSPDNDCVGDCVGLGPTVTPTIPPTKTCTNGPLSLAAGAVTFGDEASVAAPYSNYARTVRIQDCSTTFCAGVMSAGMRQVTVTVSYRPISGIGIAASNKSVMLTMLVAQR